MDNNDFSNDSSRHQQYRATSNLNTAIENPEFNVNNAIGVNIENNDIDFETSPDVQNVLLDNNQVYQSNILPQQANQFNDEEDVSYVSSQNSYQDNSNVSTPSLSSNDNNISYEPVSYNGSYEPVMENNKKNSGITISRELKIFIFIVFILIIFILLLPYVYDFFKGLKLIVAR